VMREMFPSTLIQNYRTVVRLISLIQRSQMGLLFQLLVNISKQHQWNNNQQVKVKVSVPRNRPEGPEGGRVIALLFRDLGTGIGWVVRTTLRPLYP
jgi:hypothetical protein